MYVYIYIRIDLYIYISTQNIASSLLQSLQPHAHLNMYILVCVRMCVYACAMYACVSGGACEYTCV